MGQFDFVGVWSLQTPSGYYLAPYKNGSNYILWGDGEGNMQDPANCYNVYSTPTRGTYVFQSQLNGMYLALCASSDPAGLACVNFPDPAQAQQFIPRSKPDGYTTLYLPDKFDFLGKRMDGENWSWKYVDTTPGITGSLRITAWNFNQLPGKGTDGFTLKYANLSGRVFPPKSDFTDIDFSGAILDGATLDQCNLTRANFTNCSLKQASLKSAIFVGTIFNQAHLIGAKFMGVTWTNVKANGALLDGADFTGATLTNAEMAGALMHKKILIFTNVTLEGGDFSNCDFQTVYYQGVKAVSTQSRPISFNGARLNFYMIKYNWQWMDLRNATIDQVPHALSSASSPLQSTGAKLSGLNQNNLRGVSLEHALLDYSLLDKMDLSDAVLTSASFIDASLHGTNLSGATLVSANMTGAQLGALGHLFTLPLSAEPALNAGQISALTTLVPGNVAVVALCEKKISPAKAQRRKALPRF